MLRKRTVGNLESYLICERVNVCKGYNESICQWRRPDVVYLCMVISSLLARIILPVSIERRSICISIFCFSHSVNDLKKIVKGFIFRKITKIKKRWEAKEETDAACSVIFEHIMLQSRRKFETSMITECSSETRQ